MQKNTENNVTPPCRPLVSILGWVMEMNFHQSADRLEETNSLLFESFITHPAAADLKSRKDALMFYKDIEALCTVFAQLTAEEANELNHFLIDICQKEVKTAAV